LLFGAQARATVYSRLESLAQHDQMVGFAWSALREGFYSAHAQSLLLVDYDLLAQAPHKVMPLIYQFIDEPWFAHDFENVEYTADEFDQRLGIPGLHTVHKKVQLKPRRSCIPPDLFEKYSQMSFWNDTSGSAAHVIANQTGQTSKSAHATDQDNSVLQGNAS